jgi:hypothetical protein
MSNSDGSGYVLVKIHGVKSANLRTFLASGDVIRRIFKLVGYVSRAISQHMREPPTQEMKQRHLKRGTNEINIAILDQSSVQQQFILAPPRTILFTHVFTSCMVGRILIRSFSRLFHFPFLFCQPAQSAI